MWPFKKNPRVTAYLENPKFRKACEKVGYKNFSDLKSFAKYLSTFHEITANRIIDAHITQEGPVFYDPIEDDPIYKERFAQVEKELLEKYPLDKIEFGQGKQIEREKQVMLQKLGIHWIPTFIMNSHIIFE